MVLLVCHHVTTVLVSVRISGRFENMLYLYNVNILYIFTSDDIMDT